jgi:hypothetical protein
MEIISAKIIKGNLNINYISKENVKENDYIEAIYENSKHYFKVIEISINENLLEVTALEVGYWCTRFDNMVNFDLMKLIGLRLSTIEDHNMITKIYEMSCWC